MGAPGAAAPRRTTARRGLRGPRLASANKGGPTTAASRRTTTSHSRWRQAVSNVTLVANSRTQPGDLSSAATITAAAVAEAARAARRAVGLN